MSGLSLTPRRLAMLRFIAAYGPTPWIDVVRVVRELEGRFELADESTDAGQRVLATLRHAGLVRRVRHTVDGHVTYPFIITAAGLAELAAPVVPDDRRQQTDLLGFGF